MRIGLHIRRKPYEDARGVTVLHGRELRVVDLDTGEPIDNVEAMIWGPGSILTHPLEGEEEGIFTPAHVDAKRDYLVLVIACPAAVGD